MRVFRPAAVGIVAAAALALPASSVRTATAGPTCTPGASIAYAQGVAAIVRSGADIWGNRLLSAPGGPTYERTRKLLAPLLYAIQHKRKPMTDSGVYYLPLAYPTGVDPPKTFALVVADGSQIISRHNTGYDVKLNVGPGGKERFGSCLARAQTATLADGYLPIVETSYTDAAGVHYDQEAFAGRIYGAQSIVTLVKLTVDATEADRPALVRFVTSWPQRLVTDQPMPLHVAPGDTTTVYAAWLNKIPLVHPLKLTEATYDRSRAGVVKYWNDRLASGTQLVVPDERVMDAQRAILIQQLVQGWRYSVGNPYEELSFAEALDTADVMGEYGFPVDVKTILGPALDRLEIAGRFTAWRAGERLLAEAVYYGLYHDRAQVAADASRLGAVVDTIAGRQIADGPSAGRLQPEPLSSDVPGAVDNFPGQVVAWQGLRAIARVWRATGHAGLAAKANAIADPLEAALRRAVAQTGVHLHDGSFFVPSDLTQRVAPYGRITKTRAGSYWNLVMPYAWASGFFRPHSAAATGILRYLLTHGGRLLGVPRADAHIAYGSRLYGSGLGQVYGLNVSRFLADNDQPDQLVLSLYGMLGVAMTPDTYVSGEAISVVPIGSAYYRTMYMPPNLGANSSFLETLRMMLVHENHDASAVPHGVDLAFATPRSWLADGGTISVDEARTAVGLVSYSIQRTGPRVSIHVDAPHGVKVRMRLRLPVGVHLRRIALGTRRVSYDASTSTFVVPWRAGGTDLTATVAG